jgi:hypothetical protein
MAITVDQIRDLYPHPQPDSREDTFCTYCVGGALCLALHAEDPLIPGTLFPTKWELAASLRMANPHLDTQAALKYARRIIKANDSGNMHTAWEALDKALTEKPSDTPQHCTERNP